MKVSKYLIKIVSDEQTHFEITPEVLAKQIQMGVANLVQTFSRGSLPMVTVQQEEVPCKPGYECACTVCRQRNGQ